jgi:hypothetical protein
MKCADCRYWGAERANNRDKPLGTCRRHAPTLTRAEQLQNLDGFVFSVPRAEWPWTAFDDGCGDGAIKEGRESVW